MLAAVAEMPPAQGRVCRLHKTFVAKSLGMGLPPAMIMSILLVLAVQPELLEDRQREPMSVKY